MAAATALLKKMVLISDGLLAWILLSVGCVSALSSSAQSSSAQSSLEVAYARARLVRTQEGHEAARGLYHELLLRNPRDVSAATHIAASSETPNRHEKACGGASSAHPQKLQTLLVRHGYQTGSIHDVFRIPNDERRSESAPLSVKPLTAGSPRPPNPNTGLECLVSLFLLGVVVPVRTVERLLGQGFVDIAQQLGLAFVNDDNDTALLVPYVHIFPLNLPLLTNKKKTLYFVTDLHPTILSSTTVGNDGPVMYIGPDSLALVQHTPYFGTSKGDQRILDLCTGSGIHALVALSSFQPDSTATCVDINPRALRFVRFNAALNGVSPQRIRCRLGDLRSGSWRRRNDDDRYDVVLANPPFIPVPPDPAIQQRYGLFSSGGLTGEQVLRDIVRLTSECLVPGGWAGIVSEFVNPPSANHKQCQQWIHDGKVRLEQCQSQGTTAEQLDELCEWQSRGAALLADNENFNNDESALRLKEWLDKGTALLASNEPGSEVTNNRLNHGQGLLNDVAGLSVLDRLNGWWGGENGGLLLTNEYPVDRETYAYRRADSEDEYRLWLDHLRQQRVHRVSPGLLYLFRNGKAPIRHARTPQTNQGSIWTPTNTHAIEFTKNMLQRQQQQQQHEQP